MNSSQAKNQPSPTLPADVLDSQSFAAAFASVYHSLWLVAAGITGDRTLADDIVQDAALIALRKLGQFSVGTNFRAWMARIVRLTALNYIRKRKYQSTSPADPAVLDQSNFAAAPAADGRGRIVEQSGKLADEQPYFDDEVVEALHSVGEIPRACLLLRTIENLSYTEISEILEIPEGTAMSHVHRTKQRLRQALQAMDIYNKNTPRSS